MSASTDAVNAGHHIPVLYQQVLTALQPSAGARYIDGTLGAGGHAAGILAASPPDTLLLGLDRDPAALALAADRLEPYSDRVYLRHDSFAEMTAHVDALGWREVDGILLDLGLSSMQIDDGSRGFSFRLEGPLDMRFDPTQEVIAADLVNGLPERELADLLGRYGEEPQAKRVARAIVGARPIQTTLELADVVASAARRTRSLIHPATRTFQALRIAVNDELEELETGLKQAVDLLASGGKLLVISFHSLEDRLVKRIFKRESMDCICPPERPLCTCGHQARLRLHTRRPIRPDEAEVEANPRARSARLRVAERL